MLISLVVLYGLEAVEMTQRQEEETRVAKLMLRGYTGLGSYQRGQRK